MSYIEISCKVCIANCLLLFLVFQQESEQKYFDERSYELDFNQPVTEETTLDYGGENIFVIY